MPHQLQQPSYHAATNASARCRPPSRAQGQSQPPSPALFPTLWQQGAGVGNHHRLHRQRGKLQSKSRARASGGAHRLRAAAQATDTDDIGDN